MTRGNIANFGSKRAPKFTSTKQPTKTAFGPAIAVQRELAEASDEEEVGERVMSSESEPSYEEQVAAEERQQQRVAAYNYDAYQFQAEAVAVLAKEGISDPAEINELSAALQTKAIANKSGNAVRWGSDFRDVLTEHKAKKKADTAKAMLTMPEADFLALDASEEGAAKERRTDARAIQDRLSRHGEGEPLERSRVPQPRPRHLGSEPQGVRGGWTAGTPPCAASASSLELGSRTPN